MSYHTHTSLKHDMKSLGIQHGDTIMVHTSVRAIGHVIGGVNVIIDALLDAVGDAGTVMAYVGWEGIPDAVLEMPDDVRQLYYDNHPPFNPDTAPSTRDHGILPEMLRHRHDVKRSMNPEASMIAMGRYADALTRDHAFDYGYGMESPLAKLITLQGKVLMLGAPLDTVTLLHHAEAIANMRDKRVIHYQCPMLQNEKTVWVDIEDFCTGDPHHDYSFEQIVQNYVEKTNYTPAKIGDATSYLFDATPLVQFAVDYFEAEFGLNVSDAR